MMNKDYEIELLTPCFCAGARQDQPEIREPSIRGHLRMWHQWLKLGPVEAVWGGIKPKPKVSAVKVLLMTGRELQKAKEPILPHKSAGGGARQALSQNQAFRVRLISRYADALTKADQAMRAWLMLGCLGARGNRAAGSVWPAGLNPANTAELAKSIREIGIPKTWPVVISRMHADNPLVIREWASDTVSGNRDIFGSIRPRKSSPLKMKAVRVANRYRLLLWAEKPIVEQALQALSQKRDNKRWVDQKFDEL